MECKYQNRCGNSCIEGDELECNWYSMYELLESTKSKLDSMSRSLSMLEEEVDDIREKF